MTRWQARLLLGFVAGLAVVVPGEKVHACSCIGPIPACQAAWQASAVFAGEVLSVGEVDRRAGGMMSSRVARIRVTEAFRGDVGTEVDVFTGSGGGDCGYGFQRGARYLIHAYRDQASGRLATSICQRTKLLADAADDLAYLRGPARAPAVFGRVFGQAERQVPYELQGPGERSVYQGARITLRIAGKSSSLAGDAVTTGADGRFVLRAPAGHSYRISME